MTPGLLRAIALTMIKSSAASGKTDAMIVLRFGLIPRAGYSIDRLKTSTGKRKRSIQSTLTI